MHFLQTALDFRTILYRSYERSRSCPVHCTSPKAKCGDLDPRSFVKRNLFDPIDNEINDVKRAVDGKEDGPGENKGSERPRYDSDTT